VKAYDLDEVMAQLEPVITERTVMLTLQNGIDTEDRIIARVHRDSVVGGVAFIYSKIVAPGVIEHYKRGGVAIGELMGHKSERVYADCGDLQAGGHFLPAQRRYQEEQMGKDVLELRL
jgi:2-dehydropantoate 2-reductase